MNKYVKFFESIILGTVIPFISISILSLIMNGEKVVEVIICITITSTIIFCTFLIIDEIRRKKD